MCEYCENRIVKNCNVQVQDKTHMRNFEGELEEIPCFFNLCVPLNYCPTCGRRLGKWLT